MSEPDGVQTGEGVTAVRGPLTAVQCLNAVARVVTPWQALSDQQMAEWDGDLYDYYAANHERHYGDPRKRPTNPWKLEGAMLEGQKLISVSFGSTAGWVEAGALVWDHGLSQFALSVYTGYRKREPTDLVLGMIWELGGVRGVLNSHDPVGDTYSLDDRFFPDGWWMLRTVKRIVDEEPRLLTTLVNSEGGLWVKEMMDEVAARLERGDETPAGWSYAY